MFETLLLGLERNNEQYDSQSVLKIFQSRGSAFALSRCISWAVVAMVCALAGCGKTGQRPRNLAGQSAHVTVADYRLKTVDELVTIFTTHTTGRRIISKHGRRRICGQ
jgi:hypothetical protein